MAFNAGESGSPDGQGGNAAEEIIHIEIVDIEEYGKRNERPPRARSYRIRINKHHFTVHVSHMNGRQLLELAGKMPPESYKLQQKFHGQPPKVVQLNEEVDFTACGIERFQTFPLTETEG